MALTQGTRIGAFEITGHLGSGGMGEVYRARDTSLGREVAIKVLPDEFARDPERLARFEREAQLLASLNHQNIGTLSPDERLLALPMIVGATATIAVIPVNGGTFTPVIDFGDRATLIARQVAWAPDGASIYAAVADVNGDIVLLDGLI